MCSFILAFTILIVIFDLINDSVPVWHIASTTAPPEGCCSTKLVSTLQGFYPINSICFAETAAYSCSSPFEGQTFDHPYPKTNHHVRRTLALEVQPLSEDKQENSTQMRDLQCALEQRFETQYRAKTKNSGRWGSWMGRLEPILGRATSILALGQSTIEIPLEIEHSQQSQCKVQYPHYKGERWQGKRQEEDQEWKRRQGYQWQRPTEFFSLQSTGFPAATLACTGYRSEQPTTIRNITHTATDHRHCGAKKGSDSGTEERLPRQRHGSNRDKRAHGENGKGGGEIRKRKFKGNDEEPAYCNEISGKSSKGPDGNFGGQTSSSCALDKAYHGSCKDLGKPVARVQAATSFIPGNSGQSQSRQNLHGVRFKCYLQRQPQRHWHPCHRSPQ